MEMGHTEARTESSNDPEVVHVRTRDEELEERFQQGLACFHNADYEKAVVHFTAALRLDPTAAVLRTYRGDVYRLLGDYEQALADFTAALEIIPGSASTLVSRAAVHRLRGEPTAAVADCSVALEVDRA